jgi:putative endonuclease
MTVFSDGLWAEIHAKKFFMAQGFVCLKERYRTAWGEIDLIMARQGLLVFVEVKKRPTLGTGLNALLVKQCTRILKAASFFLQQEPADWDEIRVDLIVIYGQGQIHHQPNILQWSDSLL